MQQPLHTALADGFQGGACSSTRPADYERLTGRPGRIMTVNKDGLTLTSTVKHDRATDEVTTSSRMHQRKGQPSRVVPLIRTANQVSLAGVHYNKATTE